MTSKECMRLIGRALKLSFKMFKGLIANEKDLLIVKYHLWYSRRAIDSDIRYWDQYRKSTMKHLNAAAYRSMIVDRRLHAMDIYDEEAKAILDYLKFVVNNNLIE